MPDGPGSSTSADAGTQEQRMVQQRPVPGETREQRKARLAANQLDRAEQAKRILDLRLRGATFRAIADEEGLNPGNVHRIYSEQMAAIPKESADLLRSTELERFDIMSRRLWIKLGSGDTSVIGDLLKISDRRARLTGILTVEPDSPHGELKSALGGFLMDAIARERELEQRAALGDDAAGATGIEST